MLLVPIQSAANALSNSDSVNVYRLNPEHSRPLGRAAVAAVLLHVCLLLLVRLDVSAVELGVPPPVLETTPLASPPSGSSSPSRPNPRSAPQPERTPIPAPIARPPQPISRSAPGFVTTAAPATGDLDIGDIEAPPGPDGSGRGPGGVDSEIGPDGAYPQGAAGVTPPLLLHHTTPNYTDAGIQARVEGVVLISAVIGTDGSVGNLRVLKGLGYGLDEAALKEIASHWKFRPGLLDGRPVPVRATIEVSFSLR